MRRRCLTWALAFFLPGPLLAAPLSRSDRKYLAGVYADTWRCLAHFVSPTTGMPYDSHERLPSTSLTNAGFYMAACAAAQKTGLLSEEDALRRIEKVLDGLARVEKWRGFPVTWFNADTLQTTETQFSTVDHLGNLTAGLVLVRRAFPELRPKADALLAPMNWGILYEPANHLYRGGYRLDTKDFDIRQPWGNWYYGYLGADTRLGSFFGVATGQVPLIHWKSLDRSRETRSGQDYFVPGWQGGGLFMQCVSGLFFDERSTVLGKSAANFAYAQILHAERIAAPAWGWSAAAAPTGEYLGWGALKDEVVTPHASVLAMSYYPRRATANLRALDRLGARAPYVENGREYRFGFRDSFDWKTSRAAAGYLVLDQAMLFLALANVLHDGVVWDAVASDERVANGRKILEEYARLDGRVTEIYRRRDRKKISEALKIPLE
ncbi:MAG TPA: glucoamylase family protein [Elusimicrobiota bacterium]|nr:glucoamylase family protein [Elusimicrobiota bacterium]